MAQEGLCLFALRPTLETCIRAYYAMSRSSRGKLVAGVVVSGGWRRGVVVSGVGLINEVNRHRAQLVLGWVTVCGRVNHLGM